MAIKTSFALLMLILALSFQSAQAQDDPCDGSPECLHLYVLVRCGNSEEIRPPRLTGQLLVRVSDSSIPGPNYQDILMPLSLEGANYAEYTVVLYADGSHAYDVRFYLNGHPIGDWSGPVDPPNSVGALLVPDCTRSYLPVVQI